MIATPKKTIQVHLPAQQIEWLRARSRRRGVPPSDLVRRALRAAMAMEDLLGNNLATSADTSHEVETSENQTGGPGAPALLSSPVGTR
jgi:Arc/MetJ-type ribon-helix-helix transcriptional regulator